MKKISITKDYSIPSSVTQADIARKFNIKPQSVNAWFVGKCLPKAKYLVELATVLHVSVEELIASFEKIKEEKKLASKD